MSDAPPEIIAIDADDYHARHVGHTADGRQFFLTTPFTPAMGGSAGCEYVALYTFDKRGRLLDSQIESFGPRATAKAEEISDRYDALLASLGKVTLDRIEVAPFKIERCGTEFGLVLREPEEEDDVWAVEVQPGNYMAIFEPWDSGEYDT
jgi:hypothetical protein